jgi:hypothetical protein
MRALFELCWQHEDEYRGHGCAISSQNFAEVVFFKSRAGVKILAAAYGPSDKQ